MIRQSIAILILLAGMCFSFSSCYYDNFEEMNPKDTASVIACDTSGTVSFVKHIEPIMKNYCSTAGCHSGNTPGGGLSLVTFDEVKNSAISGKLLGSIVWDGSVSKMPKGASNKISDCDIALVKKWIATSYIQQ